MPITRTLVAALATATLLAPSALARPIDPPGQAPASAQWQDLRSPDAATPRYLGGALAKAPRHDSRHLGAGGPSHLVARPQPPTWPRHPQPIVAAPSAPHGGGGSDATAIGLGVGGAVIAAAALGGLAVRVRRPQRQRVAA